MFFLVFWFLSAYALWGALGVLLSLAPAVRVDAWCTLLFLCLLGLAASSDPWGRPTGGRAARQAVLTFLLTVLVLLPVGTLPAGLAWPLSYAVITAGYLTFLSLSGTGGGMPARRLRGRPS